MGTISLLNGISDYLAETSHYACEHLKPWGTLLEALQLGLWLVYGSFSGLPSHRPEAHSKQPHRCPVTCVVYSADVTTSSNYAIADSRWYKKVAWFVRILSSKECQLLLVLS